MYTFSEENYLKAIFHLELISEKGVATNAIAEQLATKASSVTDMVKKLSDKGLIEYKKYKGVTLTKEGRKVAANIVRKHRLWEVFLVEKLDFSWDEVHEVAEQLEHIKSPKLVDQLDGFLGFPERDPHGDPIPDKEGNINFIEKILLSTLQNNEKGICIGVKNTSPSFLKFLDKRGIILGKKITFLEKEEFDDSLLIKIDTKEISISNKIANNIYIQKI